MHFSLPSFHSRATISESTFPALIVAFASDAICEGTVIIVAILDDFFPCAIRKIPKNCDS